MTKHRAAHAAKPGAKATASLDPRRRLRSMLLAVLVALVVARPLLPSEAVAWLGDGLPLDMLWLALAMATALTAAGEGGFRARWTATDTAVALLCVCYAASAVWAAAHASPRPALNMLWEWIALALVYFLTRELAGTAVEQRGIVAVMIALAVVLASYGYYQYFVSMPADRVEYGQDADAMLLRNNQWYAPGSSERRQFENRLASPEPLATFALTNSLAGFLAPWLLVAIGIAASLRGATGTARSRLALIIAMLLVGGCLLLTQSRSAYVALGVGLLLLPCTIPAVRDRLTWRSMGIAVAALGLLVAGAIAVRGLSAGVLTQAGKSLGYRLEYWQSTLAMIRDYPWLGCGPGNFQDTYLSYKLPQASEEIVDPHNMFLEIWATAGTPALLALVALLALFAWQSWRSGRPSPPADTHDQPFAGLPESAKLSAPIAGGAAAGLFLAYFIGSAVGMPLELSKVLAGLAVGAAVLAGLWPWVRSGRLVAGLVPIALVVLVIHLSASGGISFPGVAYSFWILLALGINQTEGARSVADQQAHARRPWIAILAMGLIGAGGVACYLTAYGPVLRSIAATYRTQDEDARRDVRRMERRLLEAAAADPLSPQAWQMLAEVNFERVDSRDRSEDGRRQFRLALDVLLRLRPRSSLAYRQAGEWMLKLYERSHDPQDAEQAIAYYRRAVELYPHSALTRAGLALALAAVGQSEEARLVARRALELDAMMPHVDKKLPDDVSGRLDRLESSPSDD